MKLRSLLTTSPLLGVLLLSGLPACGDAPSSSDDSESSALKGVSLSDLTVRLSVPSEGKVRYEMINHTQEAVFGTGWHPSEPARLITVTKNGLPVAYTGPIAAKLSDAGDWSLEPGSSLARDIDIARNFEVGDGGAFEVSATDEGTLALDSAPSSLTISSSVRLTIDRPQAAARDIGVKQQGLTYGGSCNAEQRGALSGANQGATFMLNQALSAPTSRYRYWFGTPPAGQVAAQDAAATSRISDMRWLGTNADANFVCENNVGDCAANPNWIAYVYTSDARAGVHRVQLCLPYWSLAHDSSDAGDSVSGFSRVGVLVHEFSHLFGTADNGYQETAVRDLALNDWARAYQNADNFRFFVMNTGNH